MIKFHVYLRALFGELKDLVAMNVKTLKKYLFNVACLINGCFHKDVNCQAIMYSAAQFFAFFAKTKDGRAKDFSRKMTCEKFAIKGSK